MRKFISIITASLIGSSLFGAPVINIHKVVSNVSATNEIANKKASLYSIIQVNVSGVTTKANITQSENYGLVAWETFKKNSNIFFNDTSYLELNNTTVTISSLHLDWQGYITSSSFDFNITFDTNSTIFDNKASYGVFIKDAATGGQATSSTYGIDNKKPQILSATISGSELYLTIDEELSDGSGLLTNNGTILNELGASDFNFTTTGVVLANGSFALDNRKKLKFDVTSGTLSNGDVNITASITTKVKDITGNPLDSSAKVTIKPAPMLLSAKTVDSTTFSLTYSKAMTVGDTNTSCADKKTNYTLLSSTNSAIAGISINTLTTTDNTTFSFTLNGATIENSGELNVSGTLYSGWKVDINSNVADSTGKYTINDSAETRFVIEDYIKPTASSPIWYDTDLDGKLDKLEILFDEPMDTTVTTLASGKLTVRHAGATISENNFNLSYLTWSFDGKKLYIPLKSSYELSDTSIAVDDSVAISGTDSNLKDANKNVEMNDLASTTPADSASPVVSSIEFYNDEAVESYNIVDTTADMNTSGVKKSPSADILKLNFSEALNTLDDTLIEVSFDYGYTYNSIGAGKAGLSSDKKYAIVELSSANVDVNKLRVKTLASFATDSASNKISSEIIYPLISAPIYIEDKTPLYIDSNDTLSVASKKVIIPLSEAIDTSVLEANNTAFSNQFNTTCGGVSCMGTSTEKIDDKTIAVEFNSSSSVDTNVTFSYVGNNSYKLKNADKTKELQNSNTLLTKTVEADSLDVNGSIDFMSLKGIVYKSDKTPAVMGTVLSAYLATKGYKIKVSASDSLGGTTIGEGYYIITPQDTIQESGITIGNLTDTNVTINYDDVNITLKKGTSYISFTKANNQVTDDIRVVEPYVVGSTVISSVDGSYMLKVRNPHGKSADVIILSKAGEDSDYIPLTSIVNEASISASGSVLEVTRHLPYSTIYGTLAESKVVNLSANRVNKIALTKDSYKKFNTFYLPVKKSYFSYGNSNQLTPSTNRLNANSDLLNVELSSSYSLDDLLLSIKTENSKTVPYLTESNFYLANRAIKTGLTNCIKYDGVANSSATGIAGFKAITAGYGIGCSIPEQLNLYFFGEAITSSDKINSVATISNWALVGNWKYTGALYGDTQSVSPTLDSNITQIIQYNANTESSLYNLKVSTDRREQINFSTTQDGDDGLFIQFNSGTTVTW